VVCFCTEPSAEVVVLFSTVVPFPQLDDVVVSTGAGAIITGTARTTGDGAIMTGAPVTTVE
jgi:hypothetical protein